MSSSKDPEAAFGQAIKDSSERLFREVKSNVVDGVYSEEEGSRIIMGAALLLVMLGDALGEDADKISNPFLDVH